MNNWEYRKIGDVCIVERGGSPRPIDQFITEDENGINWIKIGDTTESMYITDTAQKIKPEGMKKSRYVEPGDFLLSNSMSFGRPYILKIDGCIHDGWLVLRDKDELFDKRFLYYYLSSKATYQKFKSMAVGGVVNNLNSEMVRKVDVPVPRKSEQIEIANLLDKMSSVINIRKQELQYLDELIKARFVELFGSIREDKFSKCTLREVAHIKHGFAFSGEFFSEEENGVVLVTPGNFALGGGFQEVRNKYFTSDYPEEYILQAGDLIVTMTDLSKKADTLGYGAIVPDTGKVYLHNQRIGLFDQLDERLNPVFVRWYMQTEEYRLEIVRTSTGSTVHHTSPDRILDSLIYLPPIELQNSFVRFASQVDKSKVAVQKALDEAQLLFDSFMQQYFG